MKPNIVRRASLLNVLDVYRYDVRQSSLLAAPPYCTRLDQFPRPMYHGATIHNRRITQMRDGKRTQHTVCGHRAYIVLETENARSFCRPCTPRQNALVGDFWTFSMFLLVSTTAIASRIPKLTASAKQAAIGHSLGVAIFTRQAPFSSRFDIPLWTPLWTRSNWEQRP